MKNLFIDANIWLSLYFFSNDTLNQFESLKEYLNKQIKLFVSDQVYNEVLRNRDGRIKEAWDSFSKKSFQVNKAPTFCQEYPEYDAIQKQSNVLEQQYNELKDKIKHDILTHSLKADKLLSELFDGIEKMNTSSEITSKAEQRSKVGNPPGKKDSIGDGINWELLLECVPDGEDLFLISGDGDFCSKFDNDKLNFFLEKEWNKKKKSKIHFYTTLFDFMNDHTKTLKLNNSRTKTDKKNNKDIKQLQKMFVRFSESIKESEKAASEELKRIKYKELLAQSFMDENISRINAFKNSISFNKEQFNYINKLISDEQAEDKDKKDEDK